MDHQRDLTGLVKAIKMKRAFGKLYADIHISKKMEIQPFLIPFLKLLQEKGPANFDTIANASGMPLSAVIQLGQILLKKKYIHKRKDSHDKRKKVIEMTKRGNKALMNVTPLWHMVETAVTFMTKASDEWMKRELTIEPHDRYIIDSGRSKIIEKNSQVYTAKYFSEIAGTFTLTQIEEDTYLIESLAVAARFKNLGIAQKLLEHAIKKAEKMKIDRVIFNTSTALPPAISLYFRLGFKVAGASFHKDRISIKMEKILCPLQVP